ncbi:UDP-N-acetylglucosamine 2-epimerase (non-hydrolyzing) [archaeon]|nr:UDP-N-acetylglucosamine 2-epimerase (non-hydrolyzing) [archaeon]|tara:strand:- start:5462 stop:6541 length:1080 start_codon:yes stop_codon:yes gene_type:complete
MKIGVILGVRPEIIKLAPVFRELVNRNIDHFVIHTNQHYSYDMDKLFFEELNLNPPKYNLECGYDSFKKQISFMSKRAFDVLQKEKPDNMIVFADPTSAFAGALAAAKASIDISHIEAGLRSDDLRMLEETNRIAIGQLADYHFAPTVGAKQNLLDEGTNEERIHVVGNTIVDSVYQNMEIANKDKSLLEKLNLEAKKYFLVTAHRGENVDDKETLSNILKAMDMVYQKYKLPIVWPLHPRTKKMINTFNLKIPECIKIIEPVGFLEFLQLETNARLMITDSGGIQEEACILKIPCVTMRLTTERPETVNVGSNIVAGLNPDKILESVETMMGRDTNWENPFGDGKSAVKILDTLKNIY